MWGLEMLDCVERLIDAVLSVVLAPSALGYLSSFRSSQANQKITRLDESSRTGELFIRRCRKQKDIASTNSSKTSRTLH